MGTRSLTVFVDGEEEIAVLYRQMDGYPEGHGKELADYLAGKTVISGISGQTLATAFNGMGCLAAAVVAHFKTEIGGFYLYPARTRDVDEEYIYYVSATPDGRITLVCTDADGMRQAWPSAVSAPA